MQVIKVTTAIALSDALQAKMEKSLVAKVGKDVKFEYAVEPQVLGGIKVTIGSRELDGTLRAKLDQIHERLVANINS